MTFVKLFTAKYCPNSMEAEALVRSQHFDVMVYEVDRIIPDEISDLTDGTIGLPIAIIDGIRLVSLYEIKKYISIDN
jgi:hypothetical protein